ncbi:MAG: CcmD family protein [Calditrichaeota bacterium]|nr:CcmD family protein [Calditrichota bacterium]
MSHLGFLFTAYLLIWIALAIYMLSIFRRQSRLEAELQSLQNLLQERRGPEQA